MYLVTLCILCIRPENTPGFPTVDGDNPRASASGLSYVQVDKHYFYTTYIRVNLAYHDILRAKVGKGGIYV